MNITVFGASGKVGSKVVAKLLAQGHHVKAFVYSESHLQPQPHLIIIQGDVRKAEDVALALDGSEAVISALGSWGTKTKDILSSGMNVIAPEMEKLGIKRIVSLTGADARDSQDKPKILNKLSHFVLGLLAPKIMRDGEVHIARLRESNLDWTVLRSPVMKENGQLGYVLRDKPLLPWASIARDDVASALVELVTSQNYAHACPFIARK